MGLIFYCFSYFLSFYLVTTKFLDIYPKISATHVTSHRNNKTAQKIVSDQTHVIFPYDFHNTSAPIQGSDPITAKMAFLFCGRFKIF